jgi:inorganic pyrophosphatase
MQPAGTAMKLTELDPRHWESGDRIAVIETPKHSRVKIDYDPEREIFHVHHALPAGLAFPFDFGFVPRTQAEDGDSLDVLVLMDQPGYPGLVVGIQLLGVFEAEQTEKGKTLRNDRLVARAVESADLSRVETLADVPPKVLDQFEEFFIFYNRLRGKNFRILRRSGPEKAEELIQQSTSGS